MHKKSNKHDFSALVLAAAPAQVSTASSKLIGSFLLKMQKDFIHKFIHFDINGVIIVTRNPIYTAVIFLSLLVNMVSMPLRSRV